MKQQQGGVAAALAQPSTGIRLVEVAAALNACMRTLIAIDSSRLRRLAKEGSRIVGGQIAAVAGRCRTGLVFCAEWLQRCPQRYSECCTTASHCGASCRHGCLVKNRSSHYQPATTVADGIQRFVAWSRDYYKVKS